MSDNKKKEILDRIRKKKLSKDEKKSKSNSKSESSQSRSQTQVRPQVRVKSDSKSDSSQTSNSTKESHPKNAEYVAKSRAQRKKGKLPIYKSGSEIDGRNHAARVKRLKKDGCHKLIADLEKACENKDEFKFELYKQEWHMINQSPRKDYKHPDVFEGKASNDNMVECEWEGISFLVHKDSSFKVEFCDLVINHMRLGGSLRSFAGKIKKHYQTVYGWAKDIEAFALAVDIGQNDHLGVIEKVLHMTATGMDVKELSDKFDLSRVNHETLRHISKTKYRDEFYEKVEVSNGGEKGLSELEGEELRKRVEELESREERLQSENPFKTFNPIRREN